MKSHGIQKIAIVSMVYMLFPWHFSGILWLPGGMDTKYLNSGNPWNLGLC